jgi:hypothetical protein
MISLKREVLSLVRLLHISQLLATVQCYHLIRTHRLHMRYHDRWFPRPGSVSICIRLNWLFNSRRVLAGS